jgi:hypothetical protein
LARIAGVNIPTNKRVISALRYIHGIGPSFAKEICEKVGVEATGLWVDEWPFEKQRQAVRTAYDRVVAARRPLVFARTLHLDGRRIASETLMLPLSENGTGVSMIVVALVEI